MKEIKLIGTIEEIFEKLKVHIGQKICQYYDDDRFESTLTKVDRMDGIHISICTDPYGTYYYSDSISPPIFFCVEEYEISETFEETMRRKQKELFLKNCY